MNRSTFVTLGILAFASILITFIIRGTTRLVIGDRMSLLLALPAATVSVILVVTLVGIAALDLSGIRPMKDDL